MTAISSSRHLVAKLFLLVALCAVLLPVPGASQVTFSRDWNAGKRSLAEPASNGVTECSAIWRSVNNLCAAVTKNIQHLTLCETRSLLKSLQTDDSSMESNSGNNLPIFSSSHI
ncbi:adipokinetic hormone/corazonin-related peptide-like [Anopheles nili]|uniref:adipokinetic hormone/corazonin-related peptide-like n=1 Tax=Anopheles nili TaxID=185578 RepID=UPI00237BA6FB|nr:adipokinetic hormone/corazonin-related peptide-like [Anopheles nili]